MSRRREYQGNRRRNGNRPSEGRRNNNGHKGKRQGGNPTGESNNNFNDNNNNNRPSPQIILPSPAILQEYEYATDGAAAEIIEMARLEQMRRNQWEDEYLRSHRKSMRIGQLFGSMLLITTVFAIVFLATNGFVEVAEVLAATSFLSVALANFFNKPWRTKPGRRPRR